MKSLAFLLLVASAVALVYARLAPSDPATWNIDPNDPSIKPNPKGYLMRANGDAPSPVFDAAPGMLLEVLEDIALMTPGTERLAGDPLRRQLTFLSRSSVLGLPDYTTVQAAALGARTSLVIYARSRFLPVGKAAHKARVDNWLKALEARLEAA